MSHLMLSTGLTLLVGSGAVSLPAPPLAAPPDPPPVQTTLLKTRAGLEAMKTDLTLTGSQIAVGSMKVPGVDTLPANATITSVPNKTMSVAGGTRADFIGWDLMNWSITVGSSGNPAEIYLENCRIGRDTSMPNLDNVIDAYGAATAIHVDMVGSFAGADTPGGIRAHFIKHRDSSYPHIYRRCRIRGTISDPVKLRHGEVSDCFFDPIISVSRTPVAASGSSTYPAGTLVTQPGTWNGTHSAHIWKATVDNAPGSELESASYARANTASWFYLNPHGDQMTVDQTGGPVLIQGNYFNNHEEGRAYPIGWIATNGHTNSMRLGGSGNPMTHQVTVRNNLVMDDTLTQNELIGVTDQGVAGYVPVIIDFNYLLVQHPNSKPLVGYTDPQNIVWVENWKIDNSLWVAPTGATVAGPISIIEMPGDGMVFDAAGASTATAVIKGTCYPYAQVQVRGEAGTSTGWETTYADGSGNWRADLPVAVDAGMWYVPAARYGTDDATKQTGTNLFAGGTVVILSGQSEIEHIVGTASNFNGNPYPTLLAQNLTMITEGSSGGRVWRRVTSTGTTVVNVAMVALANLFHRVRPGHKLMVIDNAVSGTSRRALHNDSDTARNWSDLQVSLDEIRGAGGEIGGYIECWYNADAAYIPGFGTNWSPNYMGQRWGGGAFSLGTVNPDRDLGRIDYILWDVTAATDAYGRAAFKRDRTKLHMMLPMPFADEPSGGGWATSGELYNFTHVAPGTTRTGTYPPGELASYRHEDMDLGRVDVETFGADSRVQTFLGAVGPAAHLSDYGGGIHPLTDDPLGTPQFGMMFAPSILRCSGYAIGEPVIDHAGVIMGAAGAYADVPVTLPNGGTLTTIRAVAGIAAPGTEPPHYQPVVGFEIRRAADTDKLRRPVFKTSETGYPAAYRGTVTIQDAGSGSGAARRGWVRITPTNAFVAGDRLEYLRGEASAVILEPRDVTARLFLNMLIEHIPGLYFPADTYPFYGVPVRPRPPMMTLT